VGFIEELRPCPRCRPQARLSPREGHFLEAICERCLGRYLPLDAREALFADLQIDEEMLRDMLESFVGEQLQCPGCGFKTREIQLRGRRAHFCRGCGGCWLDQGDLSRVTQAQVREVGVTDRDPSSLPEVAAPRWEGRMPPAYGPWWRGIRLGLVGGWVWLLGLVAALTVLFPGMSDKLVYNMVMATSAWIVWFLPTVFGRRKKTLPKLFGWNLLALALPPLWLWLLPSAIMAPGVEEPERRRKLPNASTGRALGTGAAEPPARAPNGTRVA
jgi:hypothetical protein